MLKTALGNMSRMGFERRVRVACADATLFDPMASLGQRRFDRIYFSYTLSMVPEWQMALRHAFSLLSADGELHVSPRTALKNELAKIHGASVHFEAPYRGYAWLATIRRQPAAPQSRGL